MVERHAHAVADVAGINGRNGDDQRIGKFERTGIRQNQRVGNERQDAIRAVVGAGEAQQRAAERGKRQIGGRRQNKSADAVVGVREEAGGAAGKLQDVGHVHFTGRRGVAGDQLAGSVVDPGKGISPDAGQQIGVFRTERIVGEAQHKIRIAARADHHRLPAQRTGKRLVIEFYFVG